MQTLVLSSTSPNRQMLLKRLGLAFTTTAPKDIDETPLAFEAVEDLVKRLAKAKAMSVALDFPDALIIGSDLAAILDGKIIGKPGNHHNAVQQLRAASGKRVEFFTGLCLYNTRTKNCQISVETFAVTFRHLTDAMIENYLQHEQPYQSAGSFQIEGLGIALFLSLQGDDINTLIGLPLIRLVSMLAEQGINVI